MFDVHIFGCYVIIFAIGFQFLNAKIILFRRKSRISVGDGGNEELLRLRSAYSNYLEFSTVFLMLLLTNDLLCVKSAFLHFFGIVFFTARILHFFALTKKNGLFRVIAIATCHTILGMMSLLLLYKVFLVF